jgi:hypothetical protein
MARARFEPTSAQKMQVELAVACGMPQLHLCERIINPETGKPIDRKTLRRVFRQEIRLGADTANTAVAQSLFAHATKGKGAPAVTAAKFWLQCRAGWRPTEALTVQHSGAVAAMDLADLVPDEVFERIGREMLIQRGYVFED